LIGSSMASAPAPVPRLTPGLHSATSSSTLIVPLRQHRLSLLLLPNLSLSLSQKRSTSMETNVAPRKTRLFAVTVANTVTCHGLLKAWTSGETQRPPADVYQPSAIPMTITTLKNSVRRTQPVSVVGATIATSAGLKSILRSGSLTNLCAVANLKKIPKSHGSLVMTARPSMTWTVERNVTLANGHGLQTKNGGLTKVPAAVRRR